MSLSLVTCGCRCSVFTTQGLLLVQPAGRWLFWVPEGVSGSVLWASQASSAYLPPSPSRSTFLGCLLDVYRATSLASLAAHVFTSSSSPPPGPLISQPPFGSTHTVVTVTISSSRALLIPSLLPGHSARTTPSSLQRNGRRLSTCLGFQGYVRQEQTPRIPPKNVLLRRFLEASRIPCVGIPPRPPAFSVGSRPRLS